MAILFTGQTTRRATALALVALLLSALMPWTSAAQTGDYSGSASGTVADVQLPGPGGSPPVHSVFAESTGAVNSQAQIIPDVPASEGDESQDFAVGTASPVRAEFGGQRHAPGSVQSSAPDNVSGSFDSVGPDPDSAFSTGHAETSSAAAPDGSTAATDNATSITDGQFIFHLPLRMPTASSDATVERTANGEVTATGHAQLGSIPGQRISAFGGYVTAAAIDALSSSTADGTNSANLIDFRIQDLRLGVPGRQHLRDRERRARPGRHSAAGRDDRGAGQPARDRDDHDPAGIQPALGRELFGHHAGPRVRCAHAVSDARSPARADPCKTCRSSWPPAGRTTATGPTRGG